MALVSSVDADDELSSSAGNPRPCIRVVLISGRAIPRSKQHPRLRASKTSVVHGEDGDIAAVELNLKLR